VRKKSTSPLTLLQDQGYLERTGQTVRLLTNKSADLLRFDFSFLEQRQEADYRRLGEMPRLSHYDGCRRAAILLYFGSGCRWVTTVATVTCVGQCSLLHRWSPHTRYRPTILAAVGTCRKRRPWALGARPGVSCSQSRRRSNSSWISPPITASWPA